MRIAMICTEKLPVPPIRGGAIQQYIDAVLPYIKVKHDITVFCVADPSCHRRKEAMIYVISKRPKYRTIFRV